MAMAINWTTLIIRVVIVGALMALIPLFDRNDHPGGE